MAEPDVKRLRFPVFIGGPVDGQPVPDQYWEARPVHVFAGPGLSGDYATYLRSNVSAGEGAAGPYSPWNGARVEFFHHTDTRYAEALGAILERACRPCGAVVRGDEIPNVIENPSFEASTEGWGARRCRVRINAPGHWADGQEGYHEGIDPWAPYTDVRLDDGRVWPARREELVPIPSRPDPRFDEGADFPTRVRSFMDRVRESLLGSDHD